MPGNFGLGTSKNCGEVAHANLLIAHQVQEPEASVIAERLEEPFHAEYPLCRHLLNIYALTYSLGSNIVVQRLHPEAAIGEGMYRVIFACVHNAGRSQMAAAFFNELADLQKAEAVSAGTEPGVRVHPEVLTVMREVGIDLSNARPQKLTEELARGAQLLITMGCGDKCPYVPGLRRVIGLYPIPKAAQ